MAMSWARAAPLHRNAPHSNQRRGVAVRHGRNNNNDGVPAPLPGRNLRLPRCGRSGPCRGKTMESGFEHGPGRLTRPACEKAQRAAVRVSCEAIKHFIAGHLYRTDLTPKTAAQALRISQRYLHKIFAESGTTFCQYVHRLRLEDSRRKLKDPEAAQRPICDIALELGFYDHAHFSRAFRKAYGLSPREFRKASA